ncbi:hypothetical protein ACTXT7_010933 [Hymenolepis weldensis]
MAAFARPLDVPLEQLAERDESSFETYFANSTVATTTKPSPPRSYAPLLNQAAWKYEPPRKFSENSPIRH